MAEVDLSWDEIVEEGDEQFAFVNNEAHLRHYGNSVPKKSFCQVEVVAHHPEANHHLAVRQNPPCAKTEKEGVQSNYFFLTKCKDAMKEERPCFRQANTYT